ncbi:hypothetical protein GOBAR_DD02499 [Gossypium barbadense]|nr:hypothetical protein GOBAR_DD02499 [Gossypium barbadense]
MGIVRFDDPSRPNMAENQLLSHSDQRVQRRCPNECGATVSSTLKKGSEGDVYASDERSMEKVHKVNHLVVIISLPRSNEVGAQAFPYNDSKRVP